MTFLLANVRKEVQRRFNDPWSFVIWLALPFVLGFMISAVSGGSGGPKIRAELLIADHDGTFVSEALASAFSRGELAEMINTTPVAEADGRARMDEGAASALLIIPEGFADDYLARREVALVLITNPSQTISPKIIRDVLEGLLDSGNYLHLVLGDELARIAGIADTEALEEDLAAGISADISRRITRASGYLFPPKIEIADATPAPEGLPASFTLLLFPGVLVMSIFFAAQGISGNYWTEKEKGTLNRWLTTPNRPLVFWLSQFLAAMVFVAIITAPLMAAGFLYLGVPFTKFAPALAWLTLAGPLLFSLLTVIQVIAPNRRAGNVFTTLVMFPFLLMGGSFFPKEALPGWLAPFADLTPNGQIIAPLKAYFLGAAGEGALFQKLLPILAAAAALALVSSAVVRWKLRR